MGRAPCSEKAGLKKGRWTAEEDEILAKYIQANGEGSWRSLPKNAGLLRCGKSCRLRWVNYLRADLKKGNFSSEEEEIIFKLHATLGRKWSLISSHLPGRTDNEIKNYWNSHLRRKIHTFWRPHNVTLPTMVNVASAMKKDESDGDVSIQRPEENVPVVDDNASTQRTNVAVDDGNFSVHRIEENVPVDDGNVSVQMTEENVLVDDNNASVRRPEENVAVDDGNVPVQRTEENVAIEEYIALPATPTKERETLPSNVLESYMDLDPFEEDKEIMDPIVSGENRASRALCSNEETPNNNSMLCPTGEEKKTDIFTPFEDFDGGMLRFNDIMDSVPLDIKEIWTLPEETENCGRNISEEREIGALRTNIMANSEALESATGESVACSSINSFLDDNNFDWDWKSVVEAADDQQCDEEENILSRPWESESPLFSCNILEVSNQ